MSEHNEKPSVIRRPPLPAVSERGVDLWQIRELRKLTPAERLRTAIASSDNVFKLFSAARRKK